MLLGGGAWETKKRVFLSFVEEDKGNVTGLRFLAATPNFDLEFYDESVRVTIDSRDGEYVKGELRPPVKGIEILSVRWCSD